MSSFTSSIGPWPVEGAPAYLRCDNGPEFITAALRDWCRFAGSGTIFIEPGSPWQNPYVESFNSRVRDELLNVTEFYTLEEARALVADFQMDYNFNRPHSSLGNWLRPCSLSAGGRNINPLDSHSGWTRNRGHATATLLVDTIAPSTCCTSVATRTSSRSKAQHRGHTAATPRT